jgi:D-inositol-3-phosphate glycosyltransferase
MSPSVNPIRIATRVARPPGTHHADIRQHNGNWLERLYRKLLKLSLPDDQQGFVRGVGVAIDSVHDAILKSPDISTLLVAHPSRVELLDRWLSYSGSAMYPLKPQLISLSAILAKPDIYDHIWLDLEGALHEPLDLRTHCLKSIFPIVSMVHGLSIHDLLYQRFLRSFLYPTYACDSYICTSKAAYKALNGILAHITENFRVEFGADLSYNGRIDIIPLFVDTDTLSPSFDSTIRSRLRIPMDAFVVLSLGYVSPLKGDVLPVFNVFRHLIRKHSDRNILWIIAGTGLQKYWDQITMVARECEIQKHIRIVVGPSDDQRLKFLQIANAFLSLSDSPQESFGLTPVEAMACGVPQIVSDWSGYRETVVNGVTGFTIPTYWTNCLDRIQNTGAAMGWEFDHLVMGQSIAINLELVFDALEALLSNPDKHKAMSEASRQRATSIYSVERFQRDFVALALELQTTSRYITKRLRPSGAPLRSDYWRFFSAYASHTLADDTLILCNGSGHIQSILDIALQQCYLEGVVVHDERVIGELCGLIDARKGTLMRWDSLVRTCSSLLTCSESESKCKLMWMLKYGIISVRK